MHLVKDYIREMAQEGATLTNEAHLHLKQCGECSNLFQMFVLHRFYTERTYDHQTRSFRARRRVSPTSEELLELV